MSELHSVNVLFENWSFQDSILHRRSYKKLTSAPTITDDILAKSISCVVNEFD